MYVIRCAKPPQTNQYLSKRLDYRAFQFLKYVWTPLNDNTHNYVDDDESTARILIFKTAYTQKLSITARHL